jgi:hypothetical protein
LVCRRLWDYGSTGPVFVRKDRFLGSGLVFSTFMMFWMYCSFSMVPFDHILSRVRILHYFTLLLVVSSRRRNGILWGPHVMKDHIRRCQQHTAATATLH